MYYLHFKRDKGAEMENWVLSPELEKDIYLY